MPAGLTFADVQKIAGTLDGVDVGSAYDSPCLRVNKKMIACIAINKEAEPNSLMIRTATIEQRDALIDEEPDVYYLKPHYEPYPCVLVRLSKVNRDALRDLLTGAWRHAAAGKPRTSRKTASTTKAKARPKVRRAVS